MKANQADANGFAVRTMSRVLGVSASGYYAWRDRGPSKRAIENAVLSKRIEQIDDARDRIYGMPAIHRELRDAQDTRFDRRGSKVSANRVARLIRQTGLRG
jgi:putative transposase